MILLNNLQRWWQARMSTHANHALTDDELVSAYQQRRSNSALEFIMLRHAQALYHFLLSLSDTVLAEDTSQLTWLQFIEKPFSYQSTNASFRTWLFGNGRNRLIDELRRLARWQASPIEELDDVENEDWQCELYFDEHEHIQQAFDQALSALPFVQKEALMLQLEGFSLQDIANMTGEKTETIKSRLRFARKQLKQQLAVSE